MKTSEWLKTHPVKALTVTGDCSLQHAARLLLDDPEGRDLFVLDAEGQVLGHLGFWHIATLLLAKLRSTLSLRELMERITLGSVADHMDDQVMCAGVDEDIDDILYKHDLFQQHLDRRVEDIPVVDEQRRLLGVIRLSDLLRDAISTDNGALNDKPEGSSKPD
jgi:CBS-domain-containing membrane protein